MRSVFYVSDRTGITAEMLGHTLLTQFESLHFEHHTFRYVDSKDKANHVITQINSAAQQQQSRPIIFSTIVDPVIRTLIAQSNGLVLDFFDIYVTQLEQELQVQSNPVVGRSHSIQSHDHYRARINAVNFALNNDDGVSTHRYPLADLIILGVSRCGKTPTCLYLAMQYGIMAANYPLIDQDLESDSLPHSLQKHKSKLLGLTIQAQRLQQIRHERRSGGQYSSIEQCRYEVEAARRIFHNEGLLTIDTSHISIEEIATVILHQMDISRRV